MILRPIQVAALDILEMNTDQKIDVAARKVYMTPLGVIVQSSSRMNGCIESVLNAMIEDVVNNFSFIDKALAWVLLHVFGRNYYPKYHVINALDLKSSNVDEIKHYDIVGLVGLEGPADSLALDLVRKKLSAKGVVFVEFYCYAEAIRRDSEGRLDHIKRRIFHLNMHAPGYFSDEDPRFDIFVNSAKRGSERLSQYLRAMQAS